MAIRCIKNIYKERPRQIVDNSELVKVLNDKVELIRDLFNGFYYGHFATTTDSDKYEIIMAGCELDVRNRRKEKSIYEI